MGRRRAAGALAVAVLAAVAVASCAKGETTTTAATTTPVTMSSGGGASGTTEADDDFTEVCGLIEDLVDSDGTLDEARDAMIEIQDASPDDLRDEWDVILDAVDELDQLDEDQADEAMDIMTAPEVLEAGTTLDDFGEDECGVDLELGEDDLLGEAPGTTIDRGGEPSDDEVDPSSSSSLQTHFDDTYGTEDWWPLFEDASAWDRSGGSGLVQWTVTLSPSIDVDALPAEDLEAACDAMVEYLVQYEDGDVSVELFDADDNKLVKGFGDDPCRAS